MKYVSLLLTFLGVNAFGQFNITHVAGLADDAAMKIDGAYCIALSPDNAHIYVGGLQEQGISVYTVQGDGSLVYASSVSDIDLTGIIDLSFSPNGDHLYVAAQNAFTGTDNGKIIKFDRDSGSGALTGLTVEVDATPDEFTSPFTYKVRRVDVSPDGENLYAGSHFSISGNGNLVTFKRDVVTGSLTFLNNIATNGSSYGLISSPDLCGAYSLTYNDLASELSLLSFDRAGDIAAGEDGSLTLVQSQTVSDVPGINNAKGLGMTSDGLYVYVNGNDGGGASGAGRMNAFKRDTVTNILTLINTANGLMGGTSTAMNTLAIHPSGGYVVSVSSGNDGYEVYSINPATGAVTFENYDGLWGVSSISDAISDMFSNVFNLSGNVMYSTSEMGGLASGHVDWWSAYNPAQSITPFTGSLRCSLPVVTGMELSDFFGELTNEGISKLTWETLSETDNDHFEIQRSSNGVDFATVGTVSGKGTTNSLNEYEHLDTDNWNGVAYYKLKQVDYDGKSTYSKTITLRKDQGCEPLVWMNYETSKVYVSLGECGVSSLGSQIRIYDVNGREVNRMDQLSGNSFELNTDGLNKGVYFVSFKNGQKTINKKIIVGLN